MIKGRPPRLPHIFQSYDAPLFFVTVCTLHRRKIPSLKAANEALGMYGTQTIKEFNVALGRYVIIPHHLHFFVRGDQNFVLGNWVKGLKRARGSPGFSITYCAMMKATHKNGNTSAKIQFARAWCTARKIGLIRARSSISTTRSMFLTRRRNGVDARVPTRMRGPKNYAAEDSESVREQAGRHYNSLLSIASLL
jgi:REP element-mobilizing transposase RayT